MQTKNRTPKVSCCAGYRGDQRPLAFWMGGRRIAVTNILSAWIEPHRRCFKIDAANGVRYRLCQATDSLSWSLERMDTPPKTCKPIVHRLQVGLDDEIRHRTSGLFSVQHQMGVDPAG